MKRTSVWGVSSRRSCRSSKNCSTLASSAILLRGIDLDYHDIEWFALEMKRDHSVVFETASKYCISAEKAMAPHSSTLAWKIPWTEEPGGLQFMGSLGVGHN